MDEIAEDATGVDGHVAGGVDAQRGLPGGRPAQAEDARRVAAGDRRDEGPVDGQRQAAGRGQRGIDGRRQRRGRERGVGLGNQERPEAADVADLGRGFAEAAEIGRGLGQGGVVGIGRRADDGQQVAEDDVPGRGRDACWAGAMLSCDAQSMVWPGLDLAHLHGDRIAVDGVVVDRSVSVSWPLWPGRRMPAGPLGATARTWAVCT